MAYNVALVSALDLAVALDLVQDGCFDRPAVVCSVIDGHAVATERARRTVL